MKKNVFVLMPLLFMLHSGIGFSQVFNEQPYTLTEVKQNDGFGNAISNDGNWMVSGSSCDSTYALCHGAGHVFKYDVGSGNWQYHQKLIPIGAHTLDFTGGVVAVAGDWIMLGSFSDDQNGYNSGAVYVFKLAGDQWIQNQVLRPEDPSREKYFGQDLTISGQLALIGAPNDSTTGFGSESGSAYVFQFDGSKWNQIQKIIPSDGQVEANYGSAVSMAGTRALVGANNHSTSVSRGGKVYAYSFDGNQLIHESDLFPSDHNAFDRFGFDISMYGNRAVISKHRDDALGVDAGAAYVYEYNLGNWQESQKILSESVFGDDYFGIDLSLNENCLVIANRNQNTLGQDVGGVSIYRNDGMAYQFIQKLSTTGKDLEDRFGRGLGCYNDHVFIGAELKDTYGVNSGQLLVYKESTP